MRLRTFGYLTGEAVGSVRDNALLSVAAVSTVAISLLVLAVVAVLGLNLRHLASAVDAQVQVVAYLDQSQLSQPEQSVAQEIGALPHVTNVQFVTKQQALTHLQDLFGPQDAGLFNDVAQNNPLPDSLNIYVDDPTAVAAVADAVGHIVGPANVQNAQDVVNKLVSFTRALRWLGAFLVAALALATVVVIGNTVRVAVYARREQIGIMKLVGATDSFIRWPFFIEGAILGLGGAVLSGAVIAWGYAWVQGLVSNYMPFLPMIQAHALLPGMVETLLLGGVLLGALGSAVSVRRHLDV